MDPPFRKVLVANRGESAVRVMATCAEMGSATVAVYSEADAGALHVRRADESYAIGGASAASSYLDGGAILRVAAACGAEAIHPGYGFLAESAAFAAECRRAGIVFVGPPPEAMRLLGDKAAAKRLARTAGVPVLEGYDGEEQDDGRLAAEAERIGYPLLIKAVAGGGGKGMRLVGAAGAFSEALEGARREALSSFGDDRVLLERAVTAARHVEFQVLADAHGNIVHLGERECSVQRRHQKVIEESPCMALTPGLREEMGAAAVAVMRAAGYVNTGTVEFLLAVDDTYHFLEVNTRLQVEHPVTEAVTGLDLVREQLRVAAGLPLAVRQDEVRPRGHAIECRLYAEDPRRGFLPSTGTVLLMRPPLLPGVRHDVGVETGDAVTPYYDAMVAKLVVHAAEREGCVERTLGALRRYSVLGVATNLALLRRVLETPEFAAGGITTSFLDDSLAQVMATPQLSEDVLLAAAGWAFTAPEGMGEGRRSSPWRSGGGGTPGTAREYRYEHDGDGYTVAAGWRSAGVWEVRIGERERAVVWWRAGATELVVREGERGWTAQVVETATATWVSLDGETYMLAREQGLSVDRLEVRERAGEGGSRRGVLSAPMPGTVVKVQVAEGEQVVAGQTLLVLEAMKMEHVIAAPHAGTVRRLACRAGDLVAAGALLGEVEA